MTADEPTQTHDRAREAGVQWIAGTQQPAGGSREDQERETALRRGEQRERERATGAAPPRDPYVGMSRPETTAYAFAALAENVRDYAIFLMDPDGVITFWGEGARLIKWWTKEQAEGAHLRLLYPPGGSEDGTAEDHLRAAAERGEYTGEGSRIRSDCSKFWAGITLTALRDHSGALLGFAKVTRDLTARRAADAMLQAAAEAADAARLAAEAANVAKSEFLATMSHEIRTPINAIIGYHSLLEMETDGPLTAGQRRHLSRASASGKHLLALISEVLDFSRIEAARLAVEHSVFRVGDAVSSALALVSSDAKARGLELADAVSGFAAGMAAWGDEGRVRQILVNLLTNAIKFTASREGQAGRITISAGTAQQPSPDAQLSGEGPWVYIRVEDTGQGISADRLEAVFEPFVQADMTLTRRYGGTGLGLAISRRLARLMNGDVTARSDVGVGSTFFLWLQAAPVASLQTGGLQGHGAGSSGQPENGERNGSNGSNGSNGAEHASHPVNDAATNGNLAELGKAILADLERVLHAYVARLKSDSATPSAHRVNEAEIEDHLASFLADLAATLASVDVTSGEPDDTLKDGTAIQRVVAERHGSQRARLGWSESEIEREFQILREELGAAVRRRAPAYLSGPNAESRLEEAERAYELLEKFIAATQQASLASYRRVAALGETEP